MKKLVCMLSVFALCSALALTACSSNAKSSEGSGESSGSSAAESTISGGAGSDIEQMIIGKWIIAEVDGHPALTNDKAVFTFTPSGNAYMSASFNSRSQLGSHWLNLLEAEVSIDGSKVTITRPFDERSTIVDELVITDITDTETSGNLVVKRIEDGSETEISEGTIRLERIDSNYEEDILGTWEGRCTSESSVFDDGQDHRWEFNPDGTFVYFNKDGDNWIPDDNALGEYFVDGNLLCSRWTADGQENREWWEITIDGDTMSWTALREGDDGKSFTATFEMKKVVG